MAHKVLTDGNGSRLIHVVGMGDYVPASMYSELLSAVVAAKEEMAVANYNSACERLIAALAAAELQGGAA